MGTMQFMVGGLGPCCVVHLLEGLQTKVSHGAGQSCVHD